MRARLNTLNEGIRIALEAIRATKIRAGLTISGVAIGVGVVVTMAAMITGIRSSILSPFEAGGADNFYLTPFDFTDVRLVGDGSGRPPWWDRPELTHEEIDRIERGVKIHVDLAEHHLAEVEEGNVQVPGIGQADHQLRRDRFP